MIAPGTAIALAALLFFALFAFIFTSNRLSSGMKRALFIVPLLLLTALASWFIGYVSKLNFNTRIAVSMKEFAASIAQAFNEAGNASECAAKAKTLLEQAQPAFPGDIGYHIAMAIAFAACAAGCYAFFKLKASILKIELALAGCVALIGCASFFYCLTLAILSNDYEQKLDRCRCDLASAAVEAASSGRMSPKQAALKIEECRNEITVCYETDRMMRERLAALMESLRQAPKPEPEGSQAK